MIFSIPFLPPIDGGNRFYAGSVPFLFALLAAALPVGHWRPREEPSQAAQAVQALGLGQSAAWLSAGMLFLTALLPLGILAFSVPPAAAVLPCADGQIAFTTSVEKGAYADILAEESAECGAAPNLCRVRFTANGMDRANDDFYSKLANMSENSGIGLRLWAGVERNSAEYYFWAVPLDLTANLQDGRIFSGCAQEIESQFQRLLLVESISQP